MAAVCQSVKCQQDKNVRKYVTSCSSCIKHYRIGQVGRALDCLVAGSTVTKAVILLPLRPVALTHKNPRGRKIIHGMRPVGRNERPIDLKIFGRISCSSDFCGCCFKMHIYFSLFCALNIYKEYILISINCNKEFWRLSQMQCYIKAQAFSISDPLLSLFLGLTGSGQGLMIFHKNESQDSPKLFVTKSPLKSLLRPCL